MSDLKIVSCKDGIFVTRQDFEVKGEPFYIINEGPFEVREISKLRMGIRKFFLLKNPKNGILYEKTK